MAKIISINDQVISIGTDDGGIEEIRSSDVNFVPHVGDEVEIFKTDSKIIVSKVEAKKNAVPEGGININLSNTQTNAAPQPNVIAISGKVVNKLAYCILFWERLESTSFMPAKPEPALRCCCFAGR